MSASSRLPDLGGRGEGWVAIQAVLVVAVVAGAVFGPGWGDAMRIPRFVAACACMVAGVGFAAWSVRALGRGLTPLPKPRRRGSLVTDGPYRLARHPIYGGGILFFLGVALATRPGALAAAAALAVLWDLKSRVEERWLRVRYRDYDDYRARVRRRLLPYLY